MKKSYKWRNFFRNYNYEWKFKLKVCLPLFLALVAVDWISKGIVQGTMKQGQFVNFIPGFLNIAFIVNPGSAYGFNANNLALAVSLATLMTVLLIIIFIFANTKSWLVGLTIVIAGSFANLVARAWAPPVISVNPNLDGTYGGVIDLLNWDFNLFGSNDYVFNFADLWVILGVIAVVIGLLVELILSAKKKTTAIQNSEETEALDKVKIIDLDQPEVPKKVSKLKKRQTPFEYKDEQTLAKLSKQEVKRYHKELKAYNKLQEIEAKEDEKKIRKSGK